MITGHCEKRGKHGWTTLVFDHGKYLDTTCDPPKMKRKREKEVLPLPPGKEYMRKEDALAILNERLLRMNAGIYVPRTDLTVSEMLDKWYKEKCEPKRAPATLSNYRLSIKYAKAALGRVPLRNLTTGMIEAAYTSMAREKSDATIYCVHKVLHAALRYGVKCKILGSNPASDAEVSMPDRQPRKPLNVEQADNLLDAVQKYSLGNLISLAMWTGLRRGELLGLRWQDVDLEEGVISVTQQLQRIDGETLIRSPKSKKSKRDVYLTDDALALLWSMRTENPDGEFVICKPDGSPYNPTYVSRRVKQIVAKAGFPMRLHDQRHTFATLTLASGVDIRVVQDILGHEDLATTQIYTHVLSELKRQAAASLGKTLSRVGHQLGTNSASESLAAK